MRVERELAVAMRDGTVLRADAYLPDGSEAVPAILSRTPYDRSLSLTPPAAADPERATAMGFALVCQDVRGQYGSDGEFYPFRSEPADGFDSVEWVAEQSWCDGAVAMAGRSYTAATQWLAAGERPPHLRAIAPIVVGSDGYHGWVYQGGCFQLGFNLFWVHLMTSGKKRAKLDEQYGRLPLGSPPLLEQSPAGGFYRDWLAHPTRDDYWRTLAINERYDRIEVPALIVGGWYDLFLGGTLENFVRLRREAATPQAREMTRLVVGPWAHGSAYGEWPDHSFEPFGDVDVDLTGLQLDFFRRRLADDREDEPPVRLFVMGVNRWRDEDDWPLARARTERWHLRSDGVLSPEPPPEGEAADRFDFDPHDPPPTVGGPTSLPGKFLSTNSGPLDQRPVEERPDVLVYSSAPLERPLEVTGPLKAVLFVATDARDADFVVKLSDVSPDGFSRILAEGVRRLRFREGFESEQPVEPGRPYELEVDLVATSNVFLPGHRIRVAVAGGSFPRFDRNAGTGAPLGADEEGDLTVARQTVFHDVERASHLIVRVA